MLAPKCAFQMDEIYSDGVDKPITDITKSIRKALNILNGISSCGDIEIKVVDAILSASYIGADIHPNISNQWSSKTVIQLMLYQHGISASDSPITYLTPHSSVQQFRNTVESIDLLWEKGKTINFQEYYQKLIECEKAHSKNVTVSVGQVAASK